MLARGRPEYTILTGRSAAHNCTTVVTAEVEPKKGVQEVQEIKLITASIIMAGFPRTSLPEEQDVDGRTQRKTSAGSIIFSMALLIKVIISLSAQGHPTEVGGWMDGGIGAYCSEEVNL